MEALPDVYVGQSEKTTLRGRVSQSLSNRKECALGIQGKGLKGEGTGRGTAFRME